MMKKQTKINFISADELKKKKVEVCMIDPNAEKRKLLNTIDLTINCESQLNELPQLKLPQEIKERLFSHQIYGVNWLYKLFLDKSGGVLGDDMGLGKTFQVIALLTGLMLEHDVKKVLIMAPVSVLPNWKRELELFLLPHVKSASIELINSDMAKKKRVQILENTFCSRSPKIVVSSHQLVTNMADEYSMGRWDYVVLDEGHVIKNPSTKLTKAMHQLSSHHRLLLTGTPIQNKLEEFYSIIDWATKGRCFGTLKDFVQNIADPIQKGQHPKATYDQISSASEAMKLLMTLTRPIILQRKKAEQPQEHLKLPEKKEIVLWIRLSSSQRRQYLEYIHSNEYHNAFSRATFPVEVINYLKTLCRHPLLVEIAKRRKQLGRVNDEIDDLASCLGKVQISQDKNPKRVNYDDSVVDILGRTPSSEELCLGSMKIRVLLKLVTKLINDDHRILVFSQSKLMLQLIQLAFLELCIPTYKIDGSTSMKDRQAIIDDFNTPEEDYMGPRVCLLTTKACGFGITLTGADRVVIFDPSWNPAEDRQAVDRAYRIGQTKPVVVYRMIQTSCIEEKIYEKQVFKEGLRVVSEKGEETERYFAGQADLKELLSLGPADKAVILDKIDNQPHLLEEDELQETLGLLGCSRHDQLYHEEKTNSDQIQNNSISTIRPEIMKKFHKAEVNHSPIKIIEPNPSIKISKITKEKENKLNRIDDDEDAEFDCSIPFTLSKPKSKTQIIDLTDDLPFTTNSNYNIPVERNSYSQESLHLDELENSESEEVQDLEQENVNSVRSNELDSIEYLNEPLQLDDYGDEFVDRINEEVTEIFDLNEASQSPQIICHLELVDEKGINEISFEDNNSDMKLYEVAIELDNRHLRDSEIDSASEVDVPSLIIETQDHELILTSDVPDEYSQNETHEEFEELEFQNDKVIILDDQILDKQNTSLLNESEKINDSEVEEESKISLEDESYCDCEGEIISRQSVESNSEEIQDSEQEVYISIQTNEVDCLDTLIKSDKFDLVENSNEPLQLDDYGDEFVDRINEEIELSKPIEPSLDESENIEHNSGEEYHRLEDAETEIYQEIEYEGPLDEFEILAQSELSNSLINSRRDSLIDPRFSYGSLNPLSSENNCSFESDLSNMNILNLVEMKDLPRYIDSRSSITSITETETPRSSICSSQLSNISDLSKKHITPILHQYSHPDLFNSPAPVQFTPEVSKSLFTNQQQQPLSVNKTTPQTPRISRPPLGSYQTKTPGISSAIKVKVSSTPISSIRYPNSMMSTKKRDPSKRDSFLQLSKSPLLPPDSPLEEQS